jgi:hypothetical protein
MRLEETFRKGQEAICKIDRARAVEAHSKPPFSVGLKSVLREERFYTVQKLTLRSENDGLAR